MRQIVDHIGTQVWHAAFVPQALFALIAGILAVLLWMLKRAALSREQDTQQAQNRDKGATGAYSVTNAHPESVPRPPAAKKTCGTIETVTPTPAPISDVDTGSAPTSSAPGDRRQPDPKLADAVDTARSAAEDEAEIEDPTGSPVLVADTGSDSAVGAHVGVQRESENAATHYFEANFRGYTGWRWAVTVATAGPEDPVTVSEVVLLPGPEALTAPEWVPWSDRVRPGDLGAGDLLPSDQDDPRLAPGTLPGDDPVGELGDDPGIGRSRVLSRQGRTEAAERWQAGEFGPDSETARLAPAACASCGFLLPLAGSMRAAFGVCANSVSPADGRVVHLEFGCGAHSEAEIDTSSTVPVAEVVYDDTSLDYESRDQ